MAPLYGFAMDRHQTTTLGDTALLGSRTEGGDSLGYNLPSANGIKT